MAKGISARLSREEARRFGLVVGAAFLALGLLVWWRGRPLTGQVFGGIGAALVLCGIVLPDLLRPVRRVWMGMALVISRVTTPIILAIMYFGVITPIGLVRRVFGHDAFRATRSGNSSWVPKEPGKQSGMKHQF